MARKGKRKGQNVEKLEAFIAGLDIGVKMSLLEEFNIAYCYADIDFNLLNAGKNSPTKYKRIMHYWE